MRRDHGGGGGIGIGGGRGERDFEEHRWDDDRRREFKCDDERGHCHTVVGAKTARCSSGQSRTEGSRDARGQVADSRGVGCCRSADARPLGGTSIHRDTSSTRLCKRNKLVDTAGAWFRGTCLTIFYRSL